MNAYILTIISVEKGSNIVCKNHQALVGVSQGDALANYLRLHGIEPNLKSTADMLKEIELMYSSGDAFDVFAKASIGKLVVTNSLCEDTNHILELSAAYYNR